MKFSIIAAMDIQRGIGKDNTLPWKLPKDMELFKRLTENHIVIMGRKTWESLPKKFRPLPKRVNIVISKTLEMKNASDVLVFGDLQTAVNFIYKIYGRRPVKDVFVIGGQQLYEEAIKFHECERLILTQLLKGYDCDTFFPPFTEKNYKAFSVGKIEVDVENDVRYQFLTYEKVHHDCDLCNRSNDIDRQLHDFYRSADKMFGLVEDLQGHIGNLELDNNYYQAKLDGSWDGIKSDAV